MSIEQIENNEIFCSVVMPVHNGEKYLREAIVSVLNQTYKNFEFLIIENCSTDSSIEIIKSYHDPRIRLIIEKDCGQVQAYNRGFKEAKGEYIFIHDHDDVSHSERFEKQLEFIKKNNINICGSYFNLINQNGNQIGRIKMPSSHATIIDELLYKNSVVFNSSVCLQKKVIEIIGDFDINYFPSADYDFHLKGITKFIYGNVPKYLYSWRQHPQQISSSYVKAITEKTIALSLKNKKHFPSGMQSTYTGLVYYYNNKLVKAFGWLIFATFRDKHTMKLVRYFSILLLLGLPLKFFRRYHLVNSKVFLSAKRNIDYIFNDESSENN